MSSGADAFEAAVDMKSAMPATLRAALVHYGRACYRRGHGDDDGELPSAHAAFRDTEALWAAAVAEAEARGRAAALREVDAVAVLADYNTRTAGDRMAVWLQGRADVPFEVRQAAAVWREMYATPEREPAP